jgi:hypothetical protein
MTKTTLILAGALLLPALANAQLYKCPGPDGKIVYSDTRCDGTNTGNLKVTPNSSTMSEREKAIEAAKQEAAKAGAAPAGAPGAPPTLEDNPNAGKVVGGRYQLTSSDKGRLQNLEVNLGRSGASDELKTATSLEMSAIRSGQDARMTSDAKSTRESLTADLSSTDAKKRKDSLNRLRELYSNY